MHSVITGATSIPFPTNFFGSKKALSIRPCTEWSRMAGFEPSGMSRKRGATRASTL